MILPQRARSSSSYVDGTFYELVYADREVAEIIHERWPEARFFDGRDQIHEERFEVEIPNLTADEFYPFAINEGIALTCLGLGIALRLPERRADCERWLDTAKAARSEATDG